MTDVHYTYSLICPNRPNCVALLFFNTEKQLVGVEFNNEATEAFKKTFGAEMPVTIAAALLFRKVGCEVKDITNINLSFDMFWGHYANKVGNIKRCKKLWKDLSNEDKIMALGFVRRLRANYTRKGLQFPYPETYLSQRRWENVLD